MSGIFRSLFSFFVGVLAFFLLINWLIYREPPPSLTRQDVLGEHGSLVERLRTEATARTAGIDVADAPIQRTATGEWYGEDVILVEYLRDDHLVLRELAPGLESLEGLEIRPRTGGEGPHVNLFTLTFPDPPGRTVRAAAYRESFMPPSGEPMAFRVLFETDER